MTVCDISAEQGFASLFGTRRGVPWTQNVGFLPYIIVELSVDLDEVLAVRFDVSDTMQGEWVTGALDADSESPACEPAANYFDEHILPAWEAAALARWPKNAGAPVITVVVQPYLTVSLTDRRPSEVRCDWSDSMQDPGGELPEGSATHSRACELIDTTVDVLQAAVMTLNNQS